MFDVIAFGGMRKTVSKVFELLFPFIDNRSFHSDYI